MNQRICQRDLPPGSKRVRSASVCARRRGSSSRGARRVAGLEKAAEGRCSTASPSVPPPSFSRSRAVTVEPGCSVRLSQEGAAAPLQSSHPDRRDVAPLTADLLLSHMSFLPASPALMNQAPLIADFTLSGPIVGPYRRGSDSSGQTLRGEGGQEGVGSISSKKTCQQNKILTNDRKDREIPPPFPVQTPSQPSLFGRWRHLLSRLTFVRYRLRKAECPPRSARASSCVCRSGRPQAPLLRGAPAPPPVSAGAAHGSSCSM